MNKPYRGRPRFWGRAISSPLRMGYPAGIHIIERSGATPRAPTLVLVHGSLDRAASFARVMRRLPEFAIVAYDRRGYQGSREAGVVGLQGHIGDLVEILSSVRSRGAPSVSAIGHSFGGDVVIGAALTDPELCDSVGAFEPPMPWLGVGRAGGDHRHGGRPPMAEDPGDEAERFFRRMVGPAAWERLPEATRAARRSDGAALVADLVSVRGDAPFNAVGLTVPAVFGRGGIASDQRHRASVAWLGAHVSGAVVHDIAGAGHGAHLSHPDHFAHFSRRVMERRRTSSRP
ncbi:MAG: alpha/beta fold hydrolase [Acidimicrobiales bacterium]